MAQDTISVSKIKVGSRFRKDFGDLTALAEDIKQQGLICPIGLTKTNTLVYGERRLRAWKAMHNGSPVKPIPYVVVDIPDEKAALYRAEEAENVLRKDFTLTEKVAIREAMERLPEPKGCEKSHPSDRGKRKTAKQTAAAKYAGFSSSDEYKAAKAVKDRGYQPLIDYMDAGKMSAHQARLVLHLTDKQLDQYDWTGDVNKQRKDQEKAEAAKRRAEEKKAEELAARREAAKRMHTHIADLLRIYQGIIETYGSVWQMLESDPWTLRSNQDEIPILHAKVSEIAKEYRKFQREIEEWLES